MPIPAMLSRTLRRASNRAWPQTPPPSRSGSAAARPPETQLRVRRFPGARWGRVSDRFAVGGARRPRACPAGARCRQPELSADGLPGGVGCQRRLNSRAADTVLARRGKRSSASSTRLPEMFRQRGTDTPSGLAPVPPNRRLTASPTKFQGHFSAATASCGFQPVRTDRCGRTLHE